MGDLNLKIGILGGGLAGLVSAYFLLSNGYKDVEILEKENEVGGLLKTEIIEGFTFDAGGSHIIFSKDKDALNFLLKFAGKVVRHRRNTKIYIKGKFIKYPFENGLGELNPEDKFFALYEYIKAWMAREKGEADEPRNFKEWIYYWFGKGIAELYLVPYNQKIWKYPLEKMGLDWVSGRVPSPPVEDVIKSALGIPTEGYIHQLNFYYPERGGIYTIAENIKKSILNMNGRIEVGFEVKKISFEDGKVIVSNGSEERIYDYVINTIPLPRILSIIKEAPEELKKVKERLVWNALVVVGIGVKKRKISDFHWVYFPYDGIFHRIAFLSNYSPYMAPEGFSSIIAEITIRKDEKPNLKRIEERVVEDLASLRIISEDEVILTKSWYWPYAYVINHLEYGHDLAKIREYLLERKIYSVGRWGAWRYLNMDAVVKNVRESLSNAGFIHE